MIAIYATTIYVKTETHVTSTVNNECVCDEARRKERITKGTRAIQSKRKEEKRKEKKGGGGEREKKKRGKRKIKRTHTH